MFIFDEKKCEENLEMLINDIKKEEIEKEMLLYFSQKIKEEMNENNLEIAWQKYKEKIML